jgi:pimeloyl-ACP methyl ester carboxylesterase
MLAGLDQLVEVLKLPRLRTGGATLNQNPATTPTGCRYSVNGIEMRVLIAGSGPDVLLLHGFPDSHKLWRYQVPALVAAGFRVIAPDLRGYGLTEIPKGGVTAYRMDQLVADVVSLLNVLGVAKVRLVGHDTSSLASCRSKAPRATAWPSLS